MPCMRASSSNEQRRRLQRRELEWSPSSAGNSSSKRICSLRPSRGSYIEGWVFRFPHVTALEWRAGILCQPSHRVCCNKVGEAKQMIGNGIWMPVTSIIEEDTENVKARISLLLPDCNLHLVSHTALRLGYGLCNPSSHLETEASVPLPCTGSTNFGAVKLQKHL